jgi:hypothetical protein
MHMIRKGQVRWLAKVNIAEQVRFVKCILGQCLIGAFQHSLIQGSPRLFAAEPCWEPSQPVLSQSELF